MMLLISSMTMREYIPVVCGIIFVAYIERRDTMPFKSKKEKLQLTDTDRERLQRISKARSEEFRRVERPVFCFITPTG